MAMKGWVKLLCVAPSEDHWCEQTLQNKSDKQNMGIIALPWSLWLYWNAKLLHIIYNPHWSPLKVEKKKRPQRISSGF